MPPPIKVVVYTRSLSARLAWSSSSESESESESERESESESERENHPYLIVEHEKLPELGRVEDHDVLVL